MAGNVEVKPFASEKGGLQASTVGYSEEQDAGGRKQASDALHGVERIAKMLKAMPEGNAIEAGGGGNFGKIANDGESALARQQRVKLGALDLPPNIAGCQEEAAVTAADIEQGARRAVAGGTAEEADSTANAQASGDAVASAVVTSVVRCKIAGDGVGLAKSAVGATQKLKGASGEWIAHIA
jgi:hypothetical protein